MRFMIAMDGGGTKTDAVLFNEEGHILARNICEGCNALDMPNGMPVIQERLYRSVMYLYGQLPHGARLSALYGGLAGSIDWFPGVLERELVPRLPGDKVRLEGDGGCLIAALQGHQDGCSLIAGTGSSLYIRRNGCLQNYGGYGYLIDTHGSGYTIGRDAFLAAFRGHDGRGPKTVLYELIRRQLGAEPVECIPRIYEGGRSFIASFAGTVFEGRRLGDSQSCRIFDDAVESLAELVRLGQNQLGDRFTVVTGGGLFAAFPVYTEALQGRIAPGITLKRLDVPPILGAAVEAMWDAGAEDTPEFRRNFIENLRAFPGTGSRKD